MKAAPTVERDSLFSPVRPQPDVRPHVDQTQGITLAESASQTS